MDDEPFIRDELKYFLEKIDNVEIVGETGYGDEVSTLVDALNPDVVFLDIELQYTNGISIARQLADRENPPAIILATAYDKYAVLGYELSVVDYILKPFSYERLVKAIEKVDNKMKSPVKTRDAFDRIGKLCVSKNDKLFLKSLEDIVYFEAHNKSVMVVCDEEQYSCQYTLKDLEELLSQDQFIRVHKSFIVNLNHIEEITPWFNYTLKLKMTGKDEDVIVNRSYVKSFKSILSI